VQHQFSTAQAVDGATALSAEVRRLYPESTSRLPVVAATLVLGVARLLHVAHRTGDQSPASLVDAGGVAAVVLDEHYRRRVVLSVAVDRRTSARPEMTEDLLEIADYACVPTAVRPSFERDMREA